MRTTFKVFTNCLVVMVISTLITGTSFARDTYDYSGNCPKNGSKMKVDKWSFYQCECTSYVSDKLNEHKVNFSNYYKDIRWSNASNWLKAAQAAGISFNSSPKHRDIAVFEYGHVAYVESVDKNFNITVSEYNYSPSYSYNIRAIKKGSKGYPKAFIHFGAK